MLSPGNRWNKKIRFECNTKKILEIIYNENSAPEKEWSRDSVQNTD